MKKRKTRTVLTILGVVIGVISIVSLLAVGIGVKEELMTDIEKSGGAKQIIVTGVNEGKNRTHMLTDAKMEDFRKIDNVTGVYPELQIPTDGLVYGKYRCYTSVTAVPASYMEKLTLINGSLPDPDANKPELLFSKDALYFLYNDTSEKSYYETYEDDEEKLNLTGERLNTEIPVGENVKKDQFRITGMVEGYDIYCDIDCAKKYLKKISKGNPIPGQPLKADNTGYREWIYDTAIVEVDDIENVDRVADIIQDMGFYPQSEKEYVESMQKESKRLQIMLGGIGMIALVVAVIGIGNTMTTAVYDRINEIGMLKVLGCDTDDLLMMFLLESGILGGIGGLIGILSSYGITELFINRLAVKVMEYPKGTRLAIIPPWLALSAFFFAVVLGVLAGFFPAKWAAKLRPIDAVQKR